MAGMMTRRRALTGGARLGMGLGVGLGAALIVPRLAWAQLAATPRQTEGPFYPTQLPLDADNDLVAVKGAQAPARGIVTHVSGRILDPSGKPVAGARVEIWQCDSQGIYLHPRDRDQNRRDAGFQGFGSAQAQADGGYRFRTIRPVAYAGRTPHIHFKVLAQNHPALTTQMFVAGEPGNANDFVYRALGARAPQVTVALQPAPQAEPGALSGNFDIVLEA